MPAAEKEKIVLLQDVPAAVQRALQEQSRHLPKIRLVETPTGDEKPDLILAPQDTTVTTPAVPCLRIDPGDRLGTLLAALRRGLDEPLLTVAPFYIAGNLFIPATRNLQRPDGAATTLTEREAALLLHLARHAPDAVTRDTLLRAVWNYQADVDTHTLETHIYRLRQKLGGDDESGHVLITTAEGYTLAGVTPADDTTN